LPETPLISTIFSAGNGFDQLKAMARKPKQPSTTKKWLGEKMVKNNVFSRAKYPD
jgi:hypothetical protein